MTNLIVKLGPIEKADSTVKIEKAFQKKLRSCYTKGFISKMFMSILDLLDADSLNFMDFRRRIKKAFHADPY